jgi:hypothetical protein
MTSKATKNPSAMADAEGNRQADQEPDVSAKGQSLEMSPVPETFQQAPFPEGGARAWSVALGTAGILFCTFGYVNAFGYIQASSGV